MGIYTIRSLYPWGYLGEKFAQDQPLALSANLAFEQSYGGWMEIVLGTELYAILSSLAEAPINQGLAVTGSVNQGEIQPIGGVNEKLRASLMYAKARDSLENREYSFPIRM